MKTKKFGKYVEVEIEEETSFSDPSVKVTWSSLGSVGIQEADSFLKDLSSAVDYAFKENDKVVKEIDQ